MAKNKVFNCKAYEMLNHPDFRASLKKQFPEIERIENLDELKTLRLVDFHASRDNIMYAVYEATASENFYPSVRKKLIDANVTRKQKVVGTHVKNEGLHNECEEVQLSLSPYSKLFLRVYNPKYQSQS